MHSLAAKQKVNYLVTPFDDKLTRLINVVVHTVNLDLVGIGGYNYRYTLGSS